MSADKLDKLAYEEAIKKLEEIVSNMEDADIPLEESLKSFQEGIALSRYCREKLAEIECRVEYLLKEEQESNKAALKEKIENQSEEDEV